MANQEKVEQAVYQLLEALGENPEREGLLDTPKRVAKMYAEMFSGLNEDPKDQFTAVFSEVHDEVVLVKDIPFYSMCEHHLVPFYGKAHVAYLPSGDKVTGLSKLARAVEVAARRPQLQERLTISGLRRARKSYLCEDQIGKAEVISLIFFSSSWW